MYRRNTTCTTIIHVRTAHPRCQAQIVAQDTEQKHGKHGSGAPLSSFPLLLVVVLAEHGGCLSFVDRDRELRIWSEREARRNEWETRYWLTSKRSLFLGCWSRREVTNWRDPLTLNPWLWCTNRLNHNGRSSASFAAGECSDDSECCT